MTSRLRRRVVEPLALLFVCTCAGCPWEGAVPVGHPEQAKVDPKLLGAWHLAARGAVEETDMTVIAFDEHQYVIEVIERGKSPEHYRAFESAVGDTSLLNVLPIGVVPGPLGGAPQYVLAHYTLSPTGNLAVRFVDAQAIPRRITSAKELEAAVLAHHADPGFFAPDPQLDFMRPTVPRK